jgi:single-strand DNA-binding protein
MSSGAFFQIVSSTTRTAFWVCQGCPAKSYSHGVPIEGSLRTDKYTDKEGVERYSTDIVANEMQMLGGQGEGGGGGGRGEGGGYSSRPPQGRPAGAPSGGGRPSAPPQQDNGGFEDDDIPF